VLLQRVVGEQVLALRSKRLSVQQDLGEATVRGDPKRLRAALSNVLANAVKYTPADGKISLRLAADGKAATIDVADTGPGISTEERARVFEPFFQGHLAASGQMKGTGLGLAIAKDCVESHNGCIEIVESERGAHFRVRLPVA
jgi:two-component system sensor histidine kinase GlrK